MNMQFMKKTQYFSKLTANFNERQFFMRMRRTCIKENLLKTIDNRKPVKHKGVKNFFVQNAYDNECSAKYVYKKYNRIFKIELNRIPKVIALFEEYNVDFHGIENNPEVFYFNDQQLTNRICLLKEMGANYISVTMIMSLVQDVPVMTFKAYANIPEEVDIAQLLFSYLHSIPPEIHLNNINEHMTVFNYRQQCLNRYIRWRFKLSNIDDSKLNLWTDKLVNKPFFSIKCSFDVLYNDGKMSIKTMWDHQCLVKCSGKDLKDILTNIKTICDISFVDLMKIEPKIHKMKYENVVVIKNALEMYHIKREQIINSPEILLVDKNKFIKDWETVTSTPELQILLKHPFILRCFLVSDSITARLAYFHYVNVKDVTVNVLLRPLNAFDRVIKNTNYRKRAKEIYFTLRHELNLKPERIEEILSKNSYWVHANLFNMWTTLNYLKSQFNLADIENNLQLILYSKMTVENIVQNLTRENELLDKSNQYTTSQLLALCLYEIEKKYHFSGDGIWRD